MLNEILMGEPDAFFDDAREVTPRMLIKDSSSRVLIKWQSSKFLLNLQFDSKKKEVEGLSCGKLFKEINFQNEHSKLQENGLDIFRFDDIDRAKLVENTSNSEKHCQTERIMIPKPDWHKDLLAGKITRKNSESSSPKSPDHPLPKTGNKTELWSVAQERNVQDSTRSKEIYQVSTAVSNQVNLNVQIIPTDETNTRLSFGDTSKEKNQKTSSSYQNNIKQSQQVILNETVRKDFKLISKKLDSERAPHFPPVIHSNSSSIMGKYPGPVVIVPSQRVSYAQAKQIEDTKAAQGCTGTLSECSLV